MVDGRKKNCNRFSFERKATEKYYQRSTHVCITETVCIFHPIGSKWALTSPLSEAFSYQKLLP